MVVSKIRNLFIRMLTKDVVLYRRKSRAIGSAFSRFTKVRHLEVEINSNLVCAIRPAKHSKILRLQELRSAGVVESRTGGSTGGILSPHINSLDPHQFDSDTSSDRSKCTP